MPPRKPAQPPAADAVSSYRHDATRKNIPPSGIAAQGRIAEVPKLQYAYDPHLPPALRFDPTGDADALPELLAIARTRALTDAEARQLAEALRGQQPWLEWAGKREKKLLEVDPVALHIHERVSTQAILAIAKKEQAQRSLFADPEQEYREAVQFYRHDVDWANRMILGDSLQVMASLARREDLAGRVQMIYLDPPYGIKFASNFQPEIGKRDVKDKESDLTRELEMVKAYRDTWTLGVHSYLAYLRDRLIVARELLADTGSIFVQISDENLHRVRAVMDEVFGAENFVGMIQFQKTGGAATNLLASTVDYLLWFSRDINKVKYHQIYMERKRGDTSLDRYDRSVSPDGSAQRYTSGDEKAGCRRYQLTSLLSAGESSTSQEFHYCGDSYKPRPNSHWKTSLQGLERLYQAGRIELMGSVLRYRRLVEDFPVVPLTDRWESTQVGVELTYVVQTSTEVIKRCLLMTTDPGDLVLDPTCGSGTTAYVAEQWGRRWITIDTSRVALALARQRLLTATYPMYRIRSANLRQSSRIAEEKISEHSRPFADESQNTATYPMYRIRSANLRQSSRIEPEEPAANIGVHSRELADHANPRDGFVYKTVPHITLKSIAQNTALDVIFARHQPTLDERLAALNAALSEVTPELRQKLKTKLITKQQREGKRAVSDADTRRWELPKERWDEWQVPFDADEDWTPALQRALHAYREAWRAKMDAVNAAIAASAEQEELVDQPEPVRGVTRVSGPFTMEAVMPAALALDEPLIDANNREFSDLETFATVDDAHGRASSMATPIEKLGEHSRRLADHINAEAFLDRMVRLLRADGVRFPNNKTLAFERLEPVSGDPFLHAEGEWRTEEGQMRRVAVSIGPEQGAVSAYQVENALPVAMRRGFDDLVFAGFAFDALAQATIQDDPNPRVRSHLAHIRPDVAMGGLLKETPNSQLFTVFGQPRTELRNLPDGQHQVVMEGVDIYNPVDNTILPTGADKVAAWFLDSDYDGRTFCITQAFFPDKSAWEKLARALKGVIDEDRFATLSGTVSLPFTAGKRVAVKVIDPRGNEVMRVHRLDDPLIYAKRL